MRRSLIAAAAVLAVSAPTASAALPHVVQPGETLWTIAAANNLTTRTVAAFNGMPETANVVLGSTIQVPSTVEGYAALQRAGLIPAAPAAAPATVPSAPTGASTSVASAAPAPAGGYIVRWGDTLSALAANARVPLSAVATMNGLDPAKPLLAGTVLKLPTGAPAPPRAAEPAPSATVVPRAAPNPTPTRLDGNTVRQVAAMNGVPPSLAAAIAYQESGFNNAMVSAANARGVMQIMPGTWDWINQNLAHPPLDPNSAVDNARGGVLYLKHLLQAAGGSESMAIAGYYQGLSSVQSRGMFDDTKQYVANVQALRSRFGG